ncbi:hypothetical protein PR003_g6450 [Phytophthora rubi]|nr:hypothetical protein PR001_g6126 [Phytophthora rubi]KAE9348382.1 hypothetical protein PR003_g6450 [Phytophthora rubi]
MKTPIAPSGAATGYYRTNDKYRRDRQDAARVLSQEEAEAIVIALPSATKVLRSRGKRAVTKQYKYHSGSVYAHPRVEHDDGGRRPRRVGQLSVAGETWKELGEHQNVLPPVDYVEGFTGVVSKVLDVWMFRMKTQYGQNMEVNALIVEGATTVLGC